MKDSESVIDHFFIGRILEIPVYQRDYSWKKQNCRQLFDDLLMIMGMENKKHFFGSIIYMIDQDTDNRIIIDGQQRLTTIALLLAAIRDSCKAGIISSIKGDKFVEKITDKLYDDGEVILHTVERDKVAYDNLIRSGICDKKSTIGQNYDYFMQRISLEKENITADTLYKAIENLQVMTIRLNTKDGDDPQAVFESINSTGKSLSEGDRIRNLVLMNHEPSLQNHYYREYWVKIENNVPLVDDELQLSAYFRDYLTTVTGKIPKREETYQNFRIHQMKFVNDEEKYETFLKEVLEYSIYYKQIVENDLDHISKQASLMMFHINYLDATITYPYLMSILKKHNDSPEIMTSDEVTNVLTIMRNWLVRRMICNVQTNALNSIFSTLHKNIERLPGDDHYSDKMIYILLKKSGTSRFPLDDEVRDYLSSLNLYERRKLCPIVLSIIENNNKDTADTLKRVHNGELSVEHVMPQKISERWVADLGEGALETHEKWKHKLGNLTLTAYNSQYSNRPYEEKRNLEDDGFIHSGLKLNEYMKNSPIWTAVQIEERHNILVNRFVNVLKEISTDYVAPEYDKEEMHSVYDDWNDLWGNKICGYILDGIRTDSKNARTTFIALIKELYSRDPETFEEQCKLKDNGQFGRYVVPEEGQKTFTIRDGLYLRYDFDNDTKIRLLRLLSDAMMLDPKSLLLMVNITKEGFHKRPIQQDNDQTSKQTTLFN